MGGRFEVRSTGGGKTGEVMAEIRICLGWELGINVKDRKKGFFFFFYCLDMEHY